MLYSRALLFIQSIYNTLHLLIWLLLFSMVHTEKILHWKPDAHRITLSIRALLVSNWTLSYYDSNSYTAHHSSTWTLSNTTSCHCYNGPRGRCAMIVIWQTGRLKLGLCPSWSGGRRGLLVLPEMLKVTEQNPGLEPAGEVSTPQPGEDLHPLLLALLPTPSWAFSGLLLAANVKVTTCCRSFLSPYLHL